MYQDEKLVCEDCGAEFIFTAGEQEFYAEKNVDKTIENVAKCMMRFVQNAEHRHKSRLSQSRERKSIAKIVLVKK